MISSEVQRTLVKSPPELWAELSDPAALARHLGELGEIRIVRTEPERRVEWAAENTTGTVSIKPSGWGTRVTLSVTRESVEPQPETPAAAEPPSESATTAPAVIAEPVATVEPEPSTAVEPEPRAAVELPPVADGELVRQPEVEPEAATEPEVEPRRGFFSRLFGRRRRVPAADVAGVMDELKAPDAPDATLVAERPDAPDEGTTVPQRGADQPDAFAAVSRALAPEVFTAADAFAAVPAGRPAASRITPAGGQAGAEGVDDDAAQLEDLAAELMAAEEIAAEQVSTEQVTAVLTGVLDRLGAAHHRPFSRS